MVRHRSGLDSTLIIGFITAHLVTVTNILIRGVIIMFVAAVIHKRFAVWASVGYVESLAWSAGYDLVKGIVHS